MGLSVLIPADTHATEGEGATVWPLEASMSHTPLSLFDTADSQTIAS